VSIMIDIFSDLPSWVVVLMGYAILAIPTVILALSQTQKPPKYDLSITASSIFGNNTVTIGSIAIGDQFKDIKTSDSREIDNTPIPKEELPQIRLGTIYGDWILVLPNDTRTIQSISEWLNRKRLLAPLRATK